VNNNILLGETLQSFFYEQLEEAKSTESQLTEEAEAYLVRMLARQARESQVAGRTSPSLALQYLHAKDSDLSSMRELGDRALYIAGILPRSLSRGPVNITYIIGIGRTAYQEVHDRSRGVPVFAELAATFEAIATLLGKAIDCDVLQNDDLLGLYERWRRKKRPQDAKRLIAAGVLLDPVRSDVLQ